LTVAAETGVPGLLFLAMAVASLLLTLRQRYSWGSARVAEATDYRLIDALTNRPPTVIAGAAGFLAAAFFGSFIFMVFPFLFATIGLGLTEASMNSAASVLTIEHSRRSTRGRDVRAQRVRRFPLRIARNA